MPPPTQSIVPSRSIGSSLGTTRKHVANTSTPNNDLPRGKVMSEYLDNATHKNINSHFHESNCANTPANTGPDPPPTGAAAPKKAILKFRIFPGGKVVPIMAIAFGRMRPAPIPVNPRAILKDTMSLQNAFMSDHTVHHTPPNSRTRLWPYIAPSRPLIRTKLPCVNLEVAVRFCLKSC